MGRNTVGFKKYTESQWTGTNLLPRATYDIQKTLEGDVLKIVKELMRRVVVTRDRNAIIFSRLSSGRTLILICMFYRSLQVVETSSRIGTFV